MKSNLKRAEIKLEPILNIVVDDSYEPKLGIIKSDVIDNSEQLSEHEKHTQTEYSGKSTKGEGLKKPVVVFASLLLLASTIVFATDQLMRPDTFEIEELHITAKFVNLDPQQVQKKVLAQINDNYFALDLKAIEQNVQNIPWVDQVSVRRKWPKAIHITLTEQQAVARWGEQAYLNSRGEVFGLDKQTHQRQARLNKLPYLNGPQGTQQQLLKTYTQWHKLLAARKLQLDRLELTPRYAYEIVATLEAEKQNHLTQQALKKIFNEKQEPMPVFDLSLMRPFQMTLKLGKNDAEQRLRRLITNFEQIFSDRLLDVDSVDLRYPNGLAVKWHKEDLPQKYLQLAMKSDEENKG